MHKKLTAVMLCPALLLTGCQSLFNKEKGDGSGYLFTYTLTENPDSLDPQIASNSAAFTVLRNMMQGLLEEQPDGTLTYGVCSHYGVTEDGLRYTFTLRDDSYWYHDENKNDKIDDGESWLVTAHDFVYAFHRLFQKETKSPYREQFRCISGADAIIDSNASVETLGVYASGDNTLVFELSEPCAEFLNLLCMPAAMPCSREFFEQTGGRYGLDEDSVISNSGFYLRRWFYDPYGKDNLIYLQENSANDSVQKVYPSDVTFLIRSSQEQAENEFAAGKSDILAASCISSQYTEANGYTVTSWKASTLGFVLNEKWEAFGSKDIRKAFSMAVPRNMFPEDPQNDTEAAYGIVPPETRVGASLYSSYTEVQPIADSTEEEAYALFQKGMHELGLSSLPSAEILVCENTVSEDDLYETIQTWQALFGFYAGIEVVPESEYNQRLADKDYVIALYSVTGSRNSAASVLQNFASDSNSFGYSNKEADELLTQTDNARDWGELAQVCIQAEQIVIEDYIFLPVLYKNKY
ncbi:MAG: peptide ABC transporter substrate-binding protein, partial [Oscillospiraceae bacterium]|nr:peptide ABC transporter substrate-binding protein [Oscillospiraceae bacterium]